MAVKPSLILFVALVFVSFIEASPKNTSDDAVASSVIYHDTPQNSGNDEKYETQESKPRTRRQSYSYGGTQRPVSYHEEYNSPPYHYESNNPPQSYHHEYHSPPSSRHYSHSYNSPPQHHSSSYGNQDSNDYHDGNQQGHHSDPYGGGGGDYGDNDGYGSNNYEGNDGYENSPSNRYEREIRGDADDEREDYTGRINLEY